MKTYESAGQKLFSELEGEEVSGSLGDRHRLWINKLMLKSLRVFRVHDLRGTDPVSLGQAMRFVDLACDAMEAKPGEDGVSVAFVFSLPGRPGELFHQKGVKVGRLWGSTEFEKLKRALSEMDAEVHMVFVAKERRHYNPNIISMYFLEDDWVQLKFDGSVKVGRDLAMTTTKKYRCDGLAGVRQCLDHLRIDH